MFNSIPTYYKAHLKQENWTKVLYSHKNIPIYVYIDTLAYKNTYKKNKHKDETSVTYVEVKASFFLSVFEQAWERHSLVFRTTKVKWSGDHRVTTWTKRNKFRFLFVKTQS